MLGGDRVDYARPVDVEVAYHDDWNSDVHIIWSDVKLTATLWQRIQASPLFRAALFVLLPIALLCLVFRQNVSLRRWSPIFVPLLEAASARLWPDLMKLGLDRHHCLGGPCVDRDALRSVIITANVPRDRVAGADGASGPTGDAPSTRPFPGLS